MKKVLSEIARQYRLVAVYAFGSRSDEIAGRFEGEAIQSQFPNPNAEAEFELYVLRRAGDLAALEQERRRLIMRGEVF